MNTLATNKTISQSLIQAHQSGKPVFLDCVLSEQDAYAIQALSNKSLNANPQFWKTGLLSNNSVFCAPIALSSCQTSLADFSQQRFNALHVEAELAYRFHSGFEAGKSYQEDEVFAAIDNVAVAIEVLDSRLENWQDADEFLHLADNQMNGALVIGSGIGNWQSINISAQTMSLFINDELVITDSGNHLPINPTRLLTAFVNQTCRLGYTMRPGSWVTTGTWSAYPSARPGDQVRVEFPGIGEANVIL